MKTSFKYFILLFLLVMTETCHAKPKKYEVIYQSSYKNISLTDVLRTDSSTVLSFVCQTKPSDEIQIPIKGRIYLEDEMGREYALLSAEGVNDDGFSRCLSLSGDVNFSMTFEPIPSDVVFFDLRTADEWYSAFAFWGIHPAGAKVPKLNPRINEIALYDKAYVTPGNAVIVGKFQNYQKPEKPDTLTIYNNLLLIPGVVKHHRTYTAPVNDDGGFVFNLPLEGHSWLEIEGKKSVIPVYLVPSDTMYVTVEKAGLMDRRIKYRSAKNNETMSSLMNANPRYAVWDLYQVRKRRERPEFLKAEYTRIGDEVKRFCAYLSWKHHLSETEQHLLYCEMKGKMEEICLNSMDESLTYIALEWRNQQIKDAVLSDEVLDCYAFLRNINTRDYSYFILPQQYFMNHLQGWDIPYNVRVLQGEDRLYGILEEYFGQPLDDEWRKRICPSSDK